MTIETDEFSELPPCHEPSDVATLYLFETNRFEPELKDMQTK